MNTSEQCQCTIQIELFNGGGDSIGMFCDSCHRFHGKVKQRDEKINPQEALAALGTKLGIKTCLNCACFTSPSDCSVERLDEIEDPNKEHCGNWCTERIFYVNAYTVTRNYGGPEEGGWWYNLQVPIASIPIVASGRDDVKIKEVQDRLEKLFKDVSYGDIYSMKGGQELSVYVEDKFAELNPKTRPHYE